VKELINFMVKRIVIREEVFMRRRLAEKQYAVSQWSLSETQTQTLSFLGLSKLCKTKSTNLCTLTRFSFQNYMLLGHFTPKKLHNYIIIM